MSSRKFVRLLKRGGAEFVRQQGTSHAIYRRVAGGRAYSCPVITDETELSPKYMRLVMKQLAFTDDEIEALLR
jgi:predicted RNA binding protein YcfA (HicA-like mRNA interferase family)